MPSAESKNKRIISTILTYSSILANIVMAFVAVLTYKNLIENQKVNQEAAQGSNLLFFISLIFVLISIIIVLVYKLVKNRKFYIEIIKSIMISIKFIFIEIQEMRSRVYSGENAEGNLEHDLKAICLTVVNSAEKIFSAIVKDNVAVVVKGVDYFKTWTSRPDGKCLRVVARSDNTAENRSADDGNVIADKDNSALYQLFVKNKSFFYSRDLNLELNYTNTTKLRESKYNTAILKTINCDAYHIRNFLPEYNVQKTDECVANFAYIGVDCIKPNAFEKNRKLCEYIVKIYAYILSELFVCNIVKQSKIRLERKNDQNCDPEQKGD